MLKLREKHADALNLHEIEIFTQKLAIKLPNNYSKFLQHTSTGLVAFNSTEIIIESNTETVGIDSIDSPENVISYWNNLQEYKEFRAHHILPIGSLISSRTLCIGYGNDNQNQMFVLDTNLEAESIQESLEELICKIQYL
ncbi:hypothetical protein BKI52_38885 [marine bacterium AO1-C]|nr:hypothetical protein BKI52_38885 [marine bacterium AO1-C]